jgi:molybdopterin converting factor small subunit
MALLKVQFHGIWGLYLGTEKKPLEGGNLDEALARIEAEFGLRLRQQLQERGVRLDGDIKKYSYIALNSTGLQQLQDNRLKDGDVLHVFPAMTGG